MLTIGEFSKVTGLTVKALRFYHEQRILEPHYVDAGSGYRYYQETQTETARAVKMLRDLGFTVAEIQEMVGALEDESILHFLKQRRTELKQRMKADRQVLQRLDEIITRTSEVPSKMSTKNYQVERKQVEQQLVAGLRMKAAYSDCGQGFAKIGKSYGRHICGKALLLLYDQEYREEADYEVLMPIRRGESQDDIEVRALEGGSCLSLMHLGPYETIGRSYEQIFSYAREHDIEYGMPTREVYHKGPGMIFRGNPDKYLTEIQLMLA